ncbi:G1 family glutamic endopeptidase [Streptomyces sp. x-19]|uniref:G1 family glutamic endopeptidase n=1 Tax=Streptomyces sp. x-19 TaxID=2789280 RepID=UPI0039817E6F
MSITHQLQVERLYRYTVPPGLETPISIATLPDARCRVRTEQDDGPYLVAYSGPDGILEFSVRPLGESSETARLFIDAATDGDGMQHVVDLRATTQPTEKMPPPPARGRTSHVREGRTIPPLGLDDCLGLSDEELFTRGYPPRPSPDLAPAAFVAWCRFVSAPFTFVEPHLVPRPDVTRTHRSLDGRDRNIEPRSLQESANWSGFQLMGDPGTYDYVYGNWNVPGGGAGPYNPYTHSAFWIGLDGTGTVDLIQAGTESDGIVDPTQEVPVCTSVYFAWTCFLPQQWAAQQIANFPVRIGDAIQRSVMVAADENSGPVMNGGFGLFSLANQTTGQYTRVMTARGSTAVSGSQTAWIMERPTIQGGHSDLATYGTATMKYPLAETANPVNWVGYLDANNDQIMMVDADGITLSTVTAVDGDTMQFTWHRYN